MAVVLMFLVLLPIPLAHVLFGDTYGFFIGLAGAFLVGWALYSLRRVDS